MKDKHTDKIAIEFISTAGNYFIVDADGGFVSLDPNGPFAHELLKRYNNYHTIGKENATLLEQNRELKEALRELIRFSASLKMTMGEALQHPDNFISSIDKAEALLNKYPEI